MLGNTTTEQIKKPSIFSALELEIYLVRTKLVSVMIKNERQSRITRMQAAKFERAIEEFDRNSVHCKNLDSRMLDAESEALESQLESLNEELSDYDRLKAGDASITLADSLEDLPTRGSS